MHVALFNGFEFHYEMIGYAIDYCKSRGVTFDVYTRPDSDWLPYYRRVFKDDSIVFLPPADIDPVRYDWIILLTDDDRHFNETMLEACVEKVLCIQHFYAIRRALPKYRIGTRHFPMNPTLPWALPCYPALSIEDKKQKVAGLTRPVVTILGESSFPSSIEQLKDEFGPFFHDCDIHIINRFNNSRIVSSEPNVHLHINVSTEEMMRVLEMTTHMLLREKNEGCKMDAISASIPMAFNFACQMIMPILWYPHWAFLGPSVKLFAPKQALNPTLSEYMSVLDQIEASREELIQQRNHAFDSILCLSV